MFWVLGFIPCWILAKILNGAGLLRVPASLELAGLDLPENEVIEEANKAIHDASVEAAAAESR